jgi:hypothetical protein
MRTPAKNGRRQLTPLDDRRRRDQARHDEEALRISRRYEPGYVALPMAGILLFSFWSVPVVGVLLLIVAMACAFGTGLLAHAHVRARREIGRPVYVACLEGNDPTEAADALDALLQALRSPRRDGKALKAAYTHAMEALQGLRPHRPLAQRIRDGYYPSRPTRFVDGEGRQTVDNDLKPYEWHWDRTIEAADGVRDLLRGSRIVTENALDAALDLLIPPLRAILRRHGIQTWRIDYMPGVGPDAIVIAHHPAIVPGDGDRDDGAVDARLTVPGDALTAAEGRLNASATMHVASIRTLATAFGNADPSLFLGDDRQTGEITLEIDLPRLVSAFIVADDATRGQERDDVRADFARSLAVTRDTLEGIMARHVAAARSVLEDQSRFIRQKHGTSALDA